MNIRRRAALLLGASVVALPWVGLAQQPGKVWRIGYLEFASRKWLVDTGRYAPLIQGLREQGRAVAAKPEGETS